MNRKQTPSPQKKAQTKSSGRSEELDEIIDRMPMAFGKWVALAVIVFAALFLLFGWIIKYPDMVTGQIKINAQNPTVRLVRSEEHTSELQSPPYISYAVFCLKKFFF